MGICLDTEQTNEVEEETPGSRTWATSGRGIATPPAGKFPMQNSSHVKFEAPKVPVIFVLGGPGSGKVTHCDNMMQEKRGIVHINITDLLQQYAIGNDMQDFGTLSSKTVTEVLMLEMKMSPTAKTYLVSGYPRSMRDVAEYSEKIQVVNGVILVSWRQKVLERQIDYGAKLGHVVLSLAKMELKNFYKNVMPVADYFDQSNMLIAVNGERNPGEVYKDFRDAVLQVLNSVEADVAAEAAEEAPVVRPPAPAPAPAPAPVPALMPAPYRGDPVMANIYDNKPEPIQVRAAANGHQPARPGRVPPVLWVIGGPGSNKATLCQRAITQAPGWAHFSFGLRLRALADTPGQAGSDASVTRATLSGGELVPGDLVRRVLREAVAQHADARGLLMDGYPRDLDQVEHFEREYKQQPNLILLDCSKLQLGRGRRDDSVAAFRRRLELFRELSLPMLKSLDAARRLFIVDGDTDTAPVRAEFEQLILEQVRQAEALRESLSAHGEVRYDSPDVYDHEAAQAANNRNNNNNIALSTISQQVAQAANRMGNGFVHNGLAHNGVAHNGVAHNGVVHNGVANGNYANGDYANGNVVNGFIGMATSKVKPMITNSVQPKAIPSHGHLDRDSLMNLYQRNGDMETHM